MGIDHGTNTHPVHSKNEELRFLSYAVLSKDEGTEPRWVGVDETPRRRGLL